MPYSSIRSSSLSAALTVWFTVYCRSMPITVCSTPRCWAESFVSCPPPVPSRSGPVLASPSSSAPSALRSYPTWRRYVAACPPDEWNTLRDFFLSWRNRVRSVSIWTCTFQRRVSVDVVHSDCVCCTSNCRCIPVCCASDDNRMHASQDYF